MATALRYRLEAGLSRGFGRLDVIAAVETTATSFFVPDVPPGRYFIRLTAFDGFGNTIATADDVEVVSP